MKILNKTVLAIRSNNGEVGLSLAVENMDTAFENLNALIKTNLTTGNRIIDRYRIATENYTDRSIAMEASAGVMVAIGAAVAAILAIIAKAVSYFFGGNSGGGGGSPGTGAFQKTEELVKEAKAAKQEILLLPYVKAPDEKEQVTVPQVLKDTHENTNHRQTESKVERKDLREIWAKKMIDDQKFKKFFVAINTQNVGLLDKIEKETEDLKEKMDRMLNKYNVQSEMKNITVLVMNNHNENIADNPNKEEIKAALNKLSDDSLLNEIEDNSNSSKELLHGVTEFVTGFHNLPVKLENEYKKFVDEAAHSDPNEVKKNLSGICDQLPAMVNPTVEGNVKKEIKDLEDFCRDLETKSYEFNRAANGLANSLNFGPAVKILNESSKFCRNMIQTRIKVLQVRLSMPRTILYGVLTATELQIDLYRNNKDMDEYVHGIKDFHSKITAAVSR